MTDSSWITITLGDVIDYDTIYFDIATDCSTFRVMAAGYDDPTDLPRRRIAAAMAVTR